MSRTEAKKTLSRKERDELLEEKDVHLIGGGMDEAPGAYKTLMR